MWGWRVRKEERRKRWGWRVRKETKGERWLRYEERGERGRGEGGEVKGTRMEIEGNKR